MEIRQNWTAVGECNLQILLKKCQYDWEGLKKEQAEGDRVEAASGHGAHMKP